MKSMLYMLNKLQALQVEMLQKNKMFWLSMHNADYTYVTILETNGIIKMFHFFSSSSAEEKMNTYNELVEFINTHDIK